MDFVFSNVKNLNNGYNSHLNPLNPYFILKDNKIYHSTKLRVFSKFSRVNKEEKRSIKETHKKIIEFSLLLINNIKIIIKSLIYINYKNNPLNTMYYIFYYIVNLKILIIKPPP